LWYHPYWFVEIHIGLEKHFAILDATNSEIKIDVNELLSARKQTPIPFDDLNIDATEGFKKDNLIYAKINEAPEVERMVAYKLKYLYPEKEILVATPHLVNVPVWEFKIQGKKVCVFGNDENYKKTISNILETNFPKKKKSQSELFAQTVGQIKKPASFFKDFVQVVKTSNKWLLLLVLIIVVIILIFIIKKIIGKI